MEVGRTNVFPQSPVWLAKWIESSLLFTAYRDGEGGGGGKRRWEWGGGRVGTFRWQ